MISFRFSTPTSRVSKAVSFRSVGSFAVQIAKAAGTRVLAKASAENQDLLKELGTDLAIDYKSKDPIEVALDVTNGNGVDVALDTVGGDMVERSLAATRKFGRLGTILGPKGDLTALISTT